MGTKERNLQREMIRKIEDQTKEYIKMREILEKMYKEWIKLIESKEKD